MDAAEDMVGMLQGHSGYKCDLASTLCKYDLFVLLGIGTVMALYTEACTVVRTDAGLSESFEVKVGLHQWFVLSPLLFVCFVMDVVSSETRSGLPSSELLYDDDLVLMA